MQGGRGLVRAVRSWKIWAFPVPVAKVALFPFALAVLQLSFAFFIRAWRVGVASVCGVAIFLASIAPKA